MSEAVVLTDLKQGATVCLGNVRRLVEDAETLFFKNRYLSSFVLSELAIEEMAKAFKLLEKDRKKEEFSRKEWKGWTQRREAHVKKLKYMRQVDDKWLEKVVMEPHGLSYEEFSKGFLKNFPWAKNIDDYREKISKRLYKSRLGILYVDYDFEKKQWVDPLKHDFAEDPNFWIQGLVRAKHLLMVLVSALERG